MVILIKNFLHYIKLYHDLSQYNFFPPNPQLSQSVPPQSSQKQAHYLIESRPMRKTILLLLLGAFTPLVLADEPESPPDTAAGKALYDAQCTVCHGVAGASVLPTQPILSAQHADYLVHSLTQFREGERVNPVMSPMATNLSDADIRNIAHYLADQPPVVAGATDEALAKAGEALYRIGDIEREIPACTACHLPTGEGVTPHYPRLSGQYADYIASSLREYAAGTRKSVSAGVMNTIAARLSEEEITQLAAYLSGLAR